MEMNEAFWDALDALVKGSHIVIDRPKGSAHPRYPEFEYPLDYGYLEETRSADDQGIDVWLSTDPSRIMDSLICTVDRLKRDSEIKVLIGCTIEEKRLIQEIYDRSESMKGLLIIR